MVDSLKYDARVAVVVVLENIQKTKRKRNSVMRIQFYHIEYKTQTIQICIPCFVHSSSSRQKAGGEEMIFI